MHLWFLPISPIWVNRDSVIMDFLAEKTRCFYALKRCSGVVAQLVERAVRNGKVRGSIPLGSMFMAAILENGG